MYRVFSRINPKELGKVLIEWTQGLNKSVEGKVVAIDGKTLRGSFDKASGQTAETKDLWEKSTSISARRSIQFA